RPVHRLADDRRPRAQRRRRRAPDPQAPARGGGHPDRRLRLRRPQRSPDRGAGGHGGWTGADGGGGVASRAPPLGAARNRRRTMIGVIVTFRYDDGVDADAVTRIAEGAAERFRGMPGLRSKAFTVDPDDNAATNFYVWESEEAARA